MIGGFKIITLCGSTKFKSEFLEEQKRLTLEGYIVISVGCFGHSGDGEVWNPGTKVMLDEMHKRKIDLADEIFVINVGGYLGESTKGEIEYAISQSKPVKYLVPGTAPQLTPLSSGRYGCQGYIIRISSSGGKAGKNKNLTASMQITLSDDMGGYYLKKSYNFIVGDTKSYDKAESKCIAWIISNPLNGKIEGTK